MRKSLLMLPLGCLLLGGCGGSPMQPPPAAISVSLSPNSSQALDVNQSLPITATVDNDSSNQGVSWTVVCPGGVNSCGTMAQARTLSGVPNKFAAPMSEGSAEQVTVTATSLSDASKSQSVQVTINPALALVSPPPAQPQAGTLGQAFSFNLMNFVQGGTAPFHWTIQSGVLPAGLNLDAAAGTVTGTPTASASAVVISFNCTDAGDPPTTLPGSVQITLTINPSGITIMSGAPPPGVAGTIYGSPHSLCCDGGKKFTEDYFQFVAIGGSGQYSWSWAAAPGSTLPPGLSCCQLIVNTGFPFPHQVIVPGVIFGTPTASGSFNVVVTVNDIVTPSNSANANYTIVIKNPPPPTVNTTPGPAIGTVNSPYVGYSFTATGGFQPLTWSETGALPPGLNFSTAGLLSGKPTAAGSFPITVQVQDSAGQNSPTQAFTIQVLSQGFVPTGSMASPRVSHTATLLNTGKVLVIGGASTTTDLASAELFDPATGTFSFTGSMETPRVEHTATLLNDGTVLVAGGIGSTSPPTVAAAELFDPATGVFSATGSMTTPRYWHTATLLQDGKVLITGGVDAAGNVLATAEIFDPASHSFAATGSMANIRMLHTATLLNSGKVLVTGGNPSSIPSELFDPNTGTFSPTGTMQSSRTALTASLLGDGTVLVAGGYDESGTALSTAEIFNPATGTFASTGSMVEARYLYTAVTLTDGRVLFAGGLQNFAKALSAAEIFDPSTGTFSATADMTAVRTSHTATLLPNGQVLVTGGQGGAPGSLSILSTAELYQ